MQYMLLIYSDPASRPAFGTPEGAKLMQDYMAYTGMLKANNAFIAGDALKGTETATSVSLKSGKVETMDGPFAETKEHLGGYYLVDVPDLDTALRYAAQIPTATHGTVEVRPVQLYG